tara:strand:- start:606 stop:866 length:261 start_codon:yes stop_codon:yes gene_type:complete
MKSSGEFKDEERIKNLKYQIDGNDLMVSVPDSLKFSFKDWDLRNDLETICPSEKEIVVFSSFLVHGLAQNLHSDIARVSLEFRLFG